MTVHGTAVPTQATSGAVQETTSDIGGYMVKGAPIADPAEALRNPYAAEINRLNTFLMTTFPRATGGHNRQMAETPVDVAIRLLSGLSATGVYARCPSEYCNKPEHHDGEHGVVNYTPAR
jgi:hypothetical protein